MTRFSRCWMLLKTLLLSPHWLSPFSILNIQMLVDWTHQFQKQSDFLLIEKLIYNRFQKNWNYNFLEKKTFLCHSCVYFICRINQLSQKNAKSLRRTGTLIVRGALRRPKQSEGLGLNHWDSVPVLIEGHRLVLEMYFEPLCVYIQLLQGHLHAQILILRRLMSLEHHSMKLNNGSLDGHGTARPWMVLVLGRTLVSNTELTKN